MRFASVLVVGLLAVGCSATTPPPTSPFAEPSAEATASAEATLPPAATPSGTPAPSTPPPLAEAEPAVARALALLAEWTSIPARDLRVMAAEPMAWPSSCLGIDPPGVVCAAAVTPGFRVLLRDPMGGVHSVHSTGPSGDARWAGEVRVNGTITALDGGGGRVTLRTADGATLVLRVPPGTSWLPAATRTAVLGSKVVAAYDPGGGASSLLAAWIALDPG